MNKSLVYAVNDFQFSEIVKESKSINEVATRLGFKHVPGKTSKESIKKRIFNLNLELKSKEIISEVKIKNTSDYNHTTQIGNVGEAKFILDASKFNLRVSKPVFEGYPYDYILDTRDGFKKIQVKTSEFKDTENTIVFDITKGVSYKQGRRISGKYNKDDVDYFYLYCIENDESYLIENPNKLSITVRLNESSHNNGLGSNFSKNILCIP